MFQCFLVKMSWNYETYPSLTWYDRMTSMKSKDHVRFNSLVNDLSRADNCPMVRPCHHIEPCANCPRCPRSYRLSMFIYSLTLKNQGLHIIYWKIDEVNGKWGEVLALINMENRGLPWKKLENNGQLYVIWCYMFVVLVNSCQLAGAISEACLTYWRKAGSHRTQGLTRDTSQGLTEGRDSQTAAYERKRNLTEGRVSHVAEFHRRLGLIDGKVTQCRVWQKGGSCILNKGRVWQRAGLHIRLDFAEDMVSRVSQNPGS